MGCAQPPRQDDHSSDWRITLLESEEVALGTMAFHFAKPANFTFTPGQFVDLALIDQQDVDDLGPSRTLTMASAPFENELTFVMRMRDSAFKRTLRIMRPGTAVRVDTPAGTFTLPSKVAEKNIFIAGGVGIAPFLSILRQAAHEDARYHIDLFYSNRRPEDAPFLTELDAMAQANPNLRFIPTMTQMATSQRPWDGETRYIRKDMIASYIGELRGPFYYLAGPPAMVESMRQKLRDAGIDTNDIFTDEFTGY